MSATWEEYHRWLAERWLESLRLSAERYREKMRTEKPAPWKRIERHGMKCISYYCPIREFAFRGLPTFDTERKIDGHTGRD